MSKGHRNVRKIARRVRHDMELAQRKRDDKLTHRILDAVARAPLSDAQVAQVRAAVERGTALSWAGHDQAMAEVVARHARGEGREWRDTKAVDVFTELGGEVVETRPESPGPGTLAGIYPARHLLRETAHPEAVAEAAAFVGGGSTVSQVSRNFRVPTAFEMPPPKDPH